MFEKQRESLEASKNYQKVKAHVVAHKVGYSNAASALAAGAAVALLKSRPTIVNNITQVTPSIAPVMNNISKPVFRPVFNNTVTNTGHVRKIIKCLETGERWGSVKEAARVQGKSASLMSQHLNHPDVVKAINARTFIIEALAAD